MGLDDNNEGRNATRTQRYDVLIELGDCHATLGETQEAAACYEEAALLDPDRAEPYVGIGVVELARSRYDEAHVAFKVALRLDNRNARAYCGLGMVCQCRNLFEHAQEHYLRSLEIDNDNLTALLGLFQASREMGSFEKVIFYLNAYLNMHPGDTAVMFCLATLYAKDGKLMQAAELLRDVMTLEPHNRDVANLLEETRHKLRHNPQPAER